jgi:glycosyltransferase involved in cell wall biosynthesis
MAGEMESEGARVLLAHTSLIVSSPPLLSMTAVPSVYYCHEYPRYIYEPGLHKTGSALTDLLIMPLLARERRVDRRAAADATVLATNSRYMADRLGSVYGRKAVPVPPGVDTDVFTPGGSRGSFVLTVGALSPYKRHHLVVEALGLLPPAARPRMIAVGDRGSRGYAEVLAKQAKAAGVRLEVMHGVPDDRLLELYRSAAVVACPQKDEPYGLVPLEAMACGTPVVAVDQGGFRENVVDGKCGLLVEVSARGMAEGLRTLLEDRTMAVAMGRNGREFVVSHRSSRVEADRVAGLMEEAAGD